MYTISKEFHFSASHQLKGLAENHPCSRLHGHNYIVEVQLQSEELDEKGFVVDYGGLSIIKDYIDSVLDHKHLNDVMDNNPTAENIATSLYKIFKLHFPQLWAVTISETPKTKATYYE